MTLGILQHLLTVIIGEKKMYFMHENMDVECRKCIASVKKKNFVFHLLSAHIKVEYAL